MVFKEGKNGIQYIHNSLGYRDENILSTYVEGIALGWDLQDKFNNPSSSCEFVDSGVCM